MTIALVLSGGGSRGAFQTGAAMCLYTVHGVRPDIITGTSVGAINGAKLAEGPAALAELRQFWLDLRGNSDMWEEADWLVELGGLQIGNSKLRDLLLDALTGQVRPVPAVSPVERFLAENARWLRAGIAGAIALSQIVGVLPQLQDKRDRGRLRSIATLDPILRKLNGRVVANDQVSLGPRGLDELKVRHSGIKLRLAVVSLETGALRYVTESGELLERDNRTRSLPAEVVWRRDPACEAPAAEVERAEAVLDRLQSKEPPWPPMHLRNIETAQADLDRAQAQLQACELQHPGHQIQEPPGVYLPRGVIASASEPGIFEPVRIGPELYVDGGIREIAPVQVAFDVGGADLEHAYVVMASALSVAAAPSFESKDFTTVLMRSLVDISLTEIASDDAMPPGGWPRPVDVIAPTFDLYNTALIDPGLIRIHMDYGFMRAADVGRFKPLPVLDLGAQGRPGRGAVEPKSRVRHTDLTVVKATQLSDAVTQMRMAAWEAEFVVFSRPAKTVVAPRLTFQPTDRDAAIVWIRLLKWLTKAVLDERSRHGLPPLPSASPWLTWEAHDWLPIGDPWSALQPLSPVVRPTAFDTFMPQGALIRDPATGAVYALSNGGRIPLADEADAAAFGFDWSATRDVPAGVADCLPLEQRVLPPMPR